MIPECAKNRPNLKFRAHPYGCCPIPGFRPKLQCLSRKASRQLVRFRTGKSPAVASGARPMASGKDDQATDTVEGVRRRPAKFLMKADARRQTCPAILALIA